MKLKCADALDAAHAEIAALKEQLHRTKVALGKSMNAEGSG